jgi:antirestriction protein
MSYKSHLIVRYGYHQTKYDLSNFTDLDELIEVVSGETAKGDYDIQLEDLDLKWDIPFEHKYFLYDCYNSFSSIRASYFEFLSLYDDESNYKQKTVLAYLEYINPGYTEPLDTILADYDQGEFSSKEDFTSYYIHDIYQNVIDTLPPILQHLDYSAISRDLFIDSFDYVASSSNVFIKK